MPPTRMNQPTPFQSLVMDTAQATNRHFRECDYGEDWSECEHCVLVYNRISRILEFAEPLIERATRHRKALEQTQLEKLQQRLRTAIDLAIINNDAPVDRAWIIDQMVRILAGDSYEIVIEGRLDKGVAP